VVLLERLCSAVARINPAIPAEENATLSFAYKQLQM